MGFLDRFKPQPKWKHPDRAVRLAAVEGLPDAEQAVLEGIALEDSDPGVRRAAVGKLASIGTIARVARDDQDEGVRLEARELLIGVAQDSSNLEESAEALAGLTDPRDVAVVARSAEAETIASAALDRLDDPRVVAVVARQGSHAGVRAAALARLSDPEDLLAVATRTEHRDVGVAAAERLATREHLEMVATRARNKVVARRARSLARELDDRERAARAEQVAAAQRAALCQKVEALAQTGDLAVAADQLAGLQAQWQLIGEGTDPQIRDRWQQALANMQDRLARSDSERAEAERRAAALAAEIEQAAESRIALCEKVEALDGDQAAVGLDEARTIWVALMPWPESARQSLQVQQVEERFARACEDCERRIARHHELAAQRVALDGLLDQAEATLALEDIVAVRQGWKLARQAWLAASAPQVADRARLERWSSLEARLSTREAEAREARIHEAQHHMTRVVALCEQLEALAGQADVPLKEVDRLMRDARGVLDRPGYFPTRHDQERVVTRLRTAGAALQPRLQELKESEEWRRWANATLQEELCAKAEALAAINDPAEVARHLRELQQAWKKVGAVPRERAEELWTRFKAACDAAWARCGEHLAQQREQEAANQQLKEALCAQAEALADSTDWIKTSEELKRLQAEWQAIGPAPRDQAKALWERFHAACDRFFTRRKTDLAERKVVWADNQKKKEALCARAEAVAESTDWTAAFAEIKRLQAEWKAVGPVRRQKAEALWKRFRAACDLFFERYKQRDQIELAAQAAQRESICDEIEGLVPVEGPDGQLIVPDRDHQVDAVLDVWRRWQDAARLPRPAAEPLEQRFAAALDRLFAATPDLFKGTRLDVDANRARMEQLCTQVESFVSGRVTPRELASTPAATLASMLKDALASNTIAGKGDDDARWRTSTVAVRDAQAAWRRLGPVPGEEGRSLEQRFRRACRRFNELRQAQQPTRPTTV